MTEHGIIRKWMYGDFELSPKIARILEKHFRKRRRAVRWVIWKYKHILIPFTVWRVKIKALLKRQKYEN